ncbi:signal peptidase complex catalytic subunit SEC11A [Gossypium australe]|uniref:Signal peptidase complex catalytic subunit SEC11A n=1 Tax=Gossypium australe TaxID=47621 RepID=A0A5B6W5M5_9ROSI|nr:signal peptidase complex catalytic subunit SEC11A [Gossypium australe]
MVYAYIFLIISCSLFLPYVGWLTIIMTDKPIIKVRARVRIEGIKRVHTTGCIGITGHNLKGVKDKLTRFET